MPSRLRLNSIDDSFVVRVIVAVRGHIRPLSSCECYALYKPEAFNSSRTGRKAVLNVSISSSVPMHTRINPSGPTSRISTPRSSSFSKTRGRLLKRPNIIKFESLAATCVFAMIDLLR